MQQAGFVVLVAALALTATLSAPTSSVAQEPRTGEVDTRSKKSQPALAGEAENSRRQSGRGLPPSIIS